MPAWQKLISSGSAASLSSLRVDTFVSASTFSGSFVGNGSGVTGVISSSFAISASWAPGSNTVTSSYALTASFVDRQFFAVYSASLDVTWSFSHNLNQQRPIITVWNLANEVVIPEKIYSPTVNQTLIYFPTSQSGFAAATVGSVLPTTETDPIFASKSGSFLLTSSYQTDSGSWNSQILNVNNATSSYLNRFTSLELTSGSLNIFSGSAQNRLSSLEQTTGSLNLYSGSNNTRLNIIELTTGSLNTFTGSATSRLNSIELVTGSYATTGSNTFKANQIISGSITISGSIYMTSGSFSGSFIGNGSGLTNISTSPSGPNTSVQFNDNGTTSGSSGFLFDKSINLVGVQEVASINAITASGNINNYIQINIQNRNNSTTASSDIVATNDTGNELGNYIDFGINGSGYNLPAWLGNANDAYVYNTGSKLLIANLTPGTHVSSSIWFVVGGGDASLNTKMVISSSGNVGVGVIKPRFALEVSGTVSSSNFIGSFSGSLQGNGSNITNVPSSSFSATSSFNTTIFSRGATIADVTNGVSTTGSYYVWRSPFTCRVQSIYGKKSGTGTSQINARRSGSTGYSLHTASNLSLPTADQWAAAASVQNTDYVAGDSLEIIITGSGATQIAVQVDFIRI